MADETLGPDDICPETKQRHEPDLTYIVVPSGASPGIVDTVCKHCGRSGSTIIDPNDINW